MSVVYGNRKLIESHKSAGKRLTSLLRARLEQRRFLIPTLCDINRLESPFILILKEEAFWSI